MISSSMDVHDRFQCEIDLFFHPSNKRRRQGYKVDTFFFVPKTLNINELTYDRSDFYKNIKNYIRLKAPELLYEDFSKYHEYLEQIVNNIKLTRNGKRDVVFQQFEYDLFVFCCSLESAITKRVKHIISSSACDKDGTDIDIIIRDINDVLCSFRKIKNKNSNIDNVNLSLQFADEYISFYIRRGLYRLLNQIDRKCPNKVNHIRIKLINLIENEIEYCKQNDILLPVAHKKNEEYIHRNKSILKKLVWSILYLDVDTKRGNKWFSHFLFSVAAGVAMIFATVIALFFQQTYGNFSLPFFIAIVIGYMGKDRMKDILRDIFADKLDAMTADRSTNVFSKNGFKIGNIKERFHYIDDEDIDPKVFEIRYWGANPQFKHLEKNEEVMKYQKRVSFRGKRFWKIYNKTNTGGLKDILRLNISPFVEKMDSPYIYDTTIENGQAVSIKSQRFYHMNVIVRYSNNVETKYQRYRIVFNRKGINRIDKITAT